MGDWSTATADEILADLLEAKQRIYDSFPETVWHLRPPEVFGHDCPNCFDPVDR